MKTPLWIICVGVLAAGLVGTGSTLKAFGGISGANPASGVVLSIDNFRFSSTTVTVPVGTTIRWTNHDDMPHTVVSEDKSFKSKVLDTGEEFIYTFTKPGTYKYFCSLHPNMTGTVIVQ